MRIKINAQKKMKKLKRYKYNVKCKKVQKFG